MVDYLVLLILTGVISLLAVQHLAICVYTTNHRFSGGRFCRSQLHYQQQKQNTTRHPQRLRRFLYIRNLLENMGFAEQKQTPVYEDNTACIEWGNNVIGGRGRAKHIDIQKHFAHEVIQNGHMKLVCVSTTSQLADILTKQLHYQQYLACVAGC
jgi:hypothetical protein